VDFYVGGGTVNPRLDSEIKPLDLTDEEKQRLVEFLEALTGSWPDLPPQRDKNNEPPGV
jgi:hypothetical protein